MSPYVLAQIQTDDKLANGAVIGCFPNLYEALAGNMPDLVTTL